MNENNNKRQPKNQFNEENNLEQLCWVVEDINFAMVLGIEAKNNFEAK